MLNWRHLTLAIAFALINAASSTDAARAGESGLFSPGFPPWPAPPNASSWCRREWQCGRHGCSWQGLCPPQTFATSYLWQVQDHWPADALAGYDDAWCRIYGPPNSPDYRQCRVNNYYTRLSVPIRATK
jgi:hypothetical protein